MPRTHAPVAPAALAAVAALAAGCGKAPRDAPSRVRRELEAPGSAAPAASRFAGVIGGRRFSIVVPGGRATREGAGGWAWQTRTPDGAAEVVAEIAIEEIGPADANTHFLVERSPRTVVRGDPGFAVVTEVVLVAGGRVFRCTHEAAVADPDSAAAKAAAERGVAACASLRVDP